MHRFADPDQFLLYHAPGTDVQVPDFRVAHLAVGQADIVTGGVQERMRAGVPQAGERGGLCQPHRIVGALREILAADPEAMVASRIFPSLAYHPVPECPEIGDVAFLLSLGYRTFLLGDEVCLRRDSVIAALNLLQAVAGEME